MAELAVGLVGVAATVGGAALMTGSGFTGRHENSYHKEMLDTQRNMDEFMKNRQRGEVTPDEEIEFLKAREEAIRRQDEYHESIESYKDASWSNPLDKWKKKKAVRRAKRAIRQSNHCLRKLNQEMYTGSGTPSYNATTGSPPGSNFADDDLRDWISQVHEAGDVSESSGFAADNPDSSSSPHQPDGDVVGLSAIGVQAWCMDTPNPLPVSAANVEEDNFAERLDNWFKPCCQIQDRFRPLPPTLLEIARTGLSQSFVGNSDGSDSNKTPTPSPPKDFVPERMPSLVPVADKMPTQNPASRDLCSDSAQESPREYRQTIRGKKQKEDGTSCAQPVLTGSGSDSAAERPKGPRSMAKKTGGRR
ncbi:hypothetical protein C8R44DRAFT_731680 [Mycena epipterygia]|nr:hypothetical protein C8R44DRAFT_731680 [Mycena epipterygia]